MAFIRILRAAAIQFSSDGAAFLAQAIAFNTLFAAIPLTLFLVALLGFVYGTTEGNIQALALVHTYAPALQGLVTRNLDSVVRYRGLSSLIAIGGLIWSGKNIFQALAYALDLSLKVPRHRHFVHDIAIAIVLVPIAGIVLVVASALPVVMSVIVRVLDLSAFKYLPEIGSYAASLGVVFVICSLLYTYLPNRPAPSPTFGMPGAAVTAIGWSLAQVAFAVYTTHTNFLKIYGAVSAAFALLLWIYLTAVIFLYGAHVSAAWERRVRKSVARVEAA
ncbi:MAG: YihY/virulence factor BrkB family protein [Candidatus Velthaea sp.]